MNDNEKAGALKQVQSLIKNGADVNAPYENGKTLLIIAIQNRNTEIVKYLIEKGADVNEKNEYEETALHNAALRGHKDIVELLIQHNFRIDDDVIAEYKRASSETTNQEIKSILRKEIEIRKLAKETLEKNPNILQEIHKLIINSDPAALKNFINNQELQSFKRLILNQLYDEDNKSEYKKSFLHFATLLQNKDMISALLDNGAFIDIRDKFARSPLFEAADSRVYYKNHLELFIKRGANLNLQDIDGNTALHIAINGDPREEERGIIKTTDGRYLNGSLFTPDIEKITMLIEKGARIDILNSNGKSIAYYILNSDNEKIRKLADIVTGKNFSSKENYEAFIALRDEFKKDLPEIDDISKDDPTKFNPKIVMNNIVVFKRGFNMVLI